MIMIYFIVRFINVFKASNAYKKAPRVVIGFYELKRAKQLALSNFLCTKGSMLMILCAADDRDQAKGHSLDICRPDTAKCS